MRLAALFLLLLGCPPGRTPTDDSATPRDTDLPDDSGDSGDTDDPITGECADDERALRDVLAGAEPSRAQVQALLGAVASSCPPPTMATLIAATP